VYKIAIRDVNNEKFTENCSLEPKQAQFNRMVSMINMFMEFSTILYMGKSCQDTLSLKCKSQCLLLDPYFYGLK
jgi:hypothetical protein